MKYDVIIVGAGPAGIFTAIEMLKLGSRKKILILEKGKAIENRHCPKSKTKQCVSCKPYCHITTGFSGAGAFSDGKLSLSYEVGGDLPTLIGEQNAQDLIDYTDKIYLDFGADSHVEGVGNTEEVKDIRKRAIKAGLKLVDCLMEEDVCGKSCACPTRIVWKKISDGLNQIVDSITLKDMIDEYERFAAQGEGEHETNLHG